LTGLAATVQVASLRRYRFPSMTTSPPRPASSQAESPARAPRVTWAAPVVPAPSPGRAPGTLNLRPPFTNRGGADSPEPDRAKRHHSESSWPPDPSEPVTARSNLRLRKGQPGEGRRDGVTEALAGLARRLGSRGRRRPPVTAWARVSGMPFTIGAKAACVREGCTMSRGALVPPQLDRAN
jgi:hypothetical protein